MRRFTRRLLSLSLVSFPLVSFSLVPSVAHAQESKLAAEFRIERQHIAESCSEFSLKQLGSCAITLATDHPFHVTFGSIAPQNGMAFGAALVTHHTPNENWRLGWDSDAVGALGGAWRAGTYFRAIRTAIAPPKPTSGPGTPITIHPYPVFNGYAQIISLPTIPFYGLGPSSNRSDKTEFGMRQAILGTAANVPLASPAIARLALSLVGEANLRFVDLRPATGDVPSIETKFTDADTPGLSQQPTFVQFGEGVRLAPALANDHLQLNYLFQWKQFVGTSGDNTFQRWTVDLGHDIPLYRTSRPGTALPTNGPNECFTGPTGDSCPSVSRDRWGTVSVRLLVSKSMVSGSNSVPFYFQPTLGGSDINGSRALPSFDDYRFRGPHVLLLQESIEHSVYGPVGVFVGSDQGKVALQDEGLGFSDLRHSYTFGFTLRAGGFPAVVLSYSTSNAEGYHIAFTINTSLLGGSSRPSLY